MSATSIEATAPPAAEPPPAAGSWLRGLWVYAVMIIVGLAGIGYTSTGGTRVTGEGPGLFWVWAAIIPIYFAACVWHGWEVAARSQQRRRLVITQALHWLAFFVAMQVAALREVRGIMNDDAEGVAMLLLLSVGTFVAGVHAWSLPICLTGVFLAVAIPLIAWIEQTVLLIALLGAVAALVFVGLWLLRRRFAASGAA